MLAGYPIYRYVQTLKLVSFTFTPFTRNVWNSSGERNSDNYQLLHCTLNSAHLVQISKLLILFCLQEMYGMVVVRVSDVEEPPTYINLLPNSLPENALPHSLVGEYIIRECFTS